MVGLLCAGQASAQGRSGITDTPLTNVKPMQELQAFGTCVARNRRQAALAVVGTVPGSPEEAKALKKWVYGDQDICLLGGTNMSMPSLFARGTIAEGLLRAGGVPESFRLPAVAVGEARDLHGVARCYTANHRAEVQKLIQIRPGGPEELTAIAALWPDFRTCMPKFNVRLNAPWIRFLLAEALLRLEPNTSMKQ
jgi:hypothetical protein